MLADNNDDGNDNDNRQFMVILAYFDFIKWRTGWQHCLSIKSLLGTFARNVVTDPGFPRKRHQPLRGVPTYYFTNFSPKLHENEEILIQSRACVPHACLRSVNGMEENSNFVWPHLLLDWKSIWKLSTQTSSNRFYKTIISDSSIVTVAIPLKSVNSDTLPEIT